MTRRLPALVVVLVVATAVVAAQNIPMPELPYGMEDLEPFMAARTVRVHYLKHHAGYLKNLNVALHEMRLAGGETKQLTKLGVDRLLQHLDRVPEQWRETIRNNGGGFVNHDFFWRSLAPPDEEERKPQGMLLAKIEHQWGSYDAFREQFTEAAKSLFGSGWTWLYYDDELDALNIANTANHDTPMQDEHKHPLLTLDVWEHAYYLQHKNVRADYIDNFWKIVDWSQAEQIFRDHVSVELKDDL